MAFISIIIPTFNRCESLEKCLQSIRKEVSPSENVEIIVVDDGSRLRCSEKNKSICQEYSVSYLWLDKNHGMAVARNRGVEISTGKWIVFVDDDIVVDDGWYDNVIKILNNISINIIGIEGRINASGRGVWDREVINENGNAYLTCHLIVRRDIFEKSGKFDEAFEKKGPYCEDHELAARLLQWGKIDFIKELSVTHQPRKIKLLKQILYSPIRTIKHLKAEYYFYKKHPDRYHLFRTNLDIWGTLRSFILFHIKNVFKRRSLYVIFRNPLQTITLLLSSCFEQLTALFYLLYLVLWERNINGYFSSLIDIDKTIEFWEISKEELRILSLRHLGIKDKVFQFFKREPRYNIFWVLKKIPHYKKCNIYLRVDDFCIDDFDNVNKFCEILRKYRFPFLAAIRGKELRKKENRKIIKYLKDCGGAIAMYGFNGEGDKFGTFESEVLQLSVSEIIEKIEEIRKNGVLENDESLIFVPPYNTIATYQIENLSGFFRIICGGPETLIFTDGYIGPVFLKKGGCYFPSLPPFYGSAKKILNTNVLKKLNILGGTICIATRFTEEVKDSFYSFSRLIASLHSSPLDWNQLY